MNCLHLQISVEDRGAGRHGAIARDRTPGVQRAHPHFATAKAADGVAVR